ncbi:MAG: hypothetical protein IRZ16_11900 [Myxococcaceae bacterium]|nr:hypothetical protein [Myxococcaceae bacterium]
MSPALLQLHHRESFERNVTFALVAGLAAGAVHLLLTRAGFQVPLAYLAISGAAVATSRGRRFDRILLIALGLALPALPFFLGLEPGWTVALAAAAAGALMVRSHLCERGADGPLASGRPGGVNYVLGAALAAGLGLIALEVIRILGVRLSAIATPSLIAAGVLGAVFALFVAIGSLPAHLALRPDPVEARCEALLPQLAGDFHSLAARALELYRQCGEALTRLTRNREREELARTLSRMTTSAVELASEWSGVEHELEERTARELSEEIANLEKSAAGARDELAKRQLLLAAESLREELGRVGELTHRRERILAKLKAQVALLERARVSLLSLRSGQAQIRAAELSALSRKFSSLSELQSDEAKLADEVATGAELAHQEAEAARRRDRIALS